MTTNLIDSLETFFNPSSVAVIGASNSFGTWGFGIMGRVSGGADTRKIYPVNNKASEIMGIKAYKSVTEIPDPIDLAVIVVPALHVPGVMQECADKGVKTAIVISSGFAEVDQSGRDMQYQMVEIATQSGMRFAGPNSLGHLNPSARFSTLAWLSGIRSGSMGFISQSGTYGERILRGGTSAGIGCSKFIASGNEANLRLEDYVEYLAQDKDTSVIAAYVEGIRDGRRFFTIAKEVTKKKPILIMKSGRTQEAAAAAKSHTSALAGSDAIHEAMFKQAGVIRVEDEDELFDAVALLVHVPLPRGRRIGILTEGGGIGVVATDACVLEGLKLAALAPSTIDRMSSLLTSYWSHGNPADMTDAGGRNQAVIPCLEAMMDDDNVDMVMMIGGLGTGGILSSMFKIPSRMKDMVDQFLETMEKDEENSLDNIKERVDRLQKPLVFCEIMRREDAPEPKIFDALRKKGIPVYQSPRRAARALSHLVWYKEYLDAK